MIDALIFTGIGIALGWFVLPQPQWAVDLWNKVTGKTPEE